MNLEQIREEAIRRGITRLCHFTPSVKMLHILVHGILPTSRLRRDFRDICDPTDEARLDGLPDHVSCSIEYPNSWYLSLVQGRNSKYDDWVVALIDPAVLWKKGTKFCPRNAAAHGGKLIGEGYDAFMQLFRQEVRGARGRTYCRPVQMLPSCPTDGQAEVLVPGGIPRSAVIGAVVRSEEQARREVIRWKFVPNLLPAPVWVCPEFFDGSWARMVRDGKRPVEKLVYTPERTVA